MSAISHNAWEIVMGLEVHVELSTKTKIFCSCTTEFGGEPNTHCCPICTGMPGVLPSLNKAVVEYATRAGLALNCEITRCNKFDRKNYFYPDLPKAYQISQLYLPICRNQPQSRMFLVSSVWETKSYISDSLTRTSTLSKFTLPSRKLMELTMRSMAISS